MADLWPVIAESFGMEVGGDVEISFLHELATQAGERDAIRTRHGLAAPDLSAFLGQSVQFAAWVLARSARTAPGTISTIRIARAGFNASTTMLAPDPRSLLP